MKLNESLEILQVSEEDIINYDVFMLKKQYHKRALVLHPDKGGNHDEFQKLHEAYSDINEILLLRVKSSPLESLDAGKYMEYFKFLMSNDNLKSFVYGKLILIIKDLISEFKRHYMTAIMKSKSKVVIELNPSLDDIKLNNIYKYNYLDTYFLVPLWHSEIYFEYNDTDIIFICNPILPAGCHVDEYNNLYIVKQYNLLEICSQRELVLDDIYELQIPIEELKIKRKQMYRFQSNGLSAINTQNIYDVSKKMDIIIHIELIY